MVRRFVAIATALVVLLSGAAVSAQEISAAEAYARATAGKLTIIDVRRPSEWRETGLPQGAVGISLHNSIFMVRRGFVDDVANALGGNRSAPVALICASGVRSARALKLLRKAGFTDLHDISEGVMGNGRAPGWLGRGLPLSPCTSC